MRAGRRVLAAAAAVVLMGAVSGTAAAAKAPSVDVDLSAGDVGSSGDVAQWTVMPSASSPAHDVTVRIAADHHLQVHGAEAGLPQWCEVVGAEVVCTFDTLPTEEMLFLDVEVSGVARFPRGEKITLTATASSPGDTNPTNDVVRGVLASPGTATVAMVVRPPVNPVPAGKPVRFRYTLTNKGAVPLHLNFSDRHFWYDIDTVRGDKVVQLPLPGPPAESFCGGNPPWWECLDLALAPGASRTLDVVVQFAASRAGQTLTVKPQAWTSTDEPVIIDSPDNAPVLHLTFAKGSTSTPTPTRTPTPTSTPTPSGTATPSSTPSPTGGSGPDGAEAPAAQPVLGEPTYTG